MGCHCASGRYTNRTQRADGTQRAGGWFVETLARVNASFPHPGHRFINNGLMAMGPLPFATCLVGRFVPAETDLVLIAFGEMCRVSGTDATMASPFAKALERIVRALLALGPEPPTIAFFNYYNKWDMAIAHRPWFRGCGESIVELTRYYGGPAVVSVRDAVFVEGRDPSSPYFWQKWATIGDHGGHLDLERGADLGADLVFGFLQRAAADAAGATAAWDRYTPRRPAPLPAASLTDADASLATSLGRCLSFGSDSEPTVTNATGDWARVDFERLADGSRAYKPGWAAEAAGSVLEIDTGTVSGAFSIGHLRSYKLLGTATVGCVPPCACVPQTLGSFSDVGDQVVEHSPAVAFASTRAATGITCRLRLVIGAPAAPDWAEQVRLRDRGLLTRVVTTPGRGPVLASGAPRNTTGRFKLLGLQYHTM
jgi:hypothetical protein